MELNVIEKSSSDWASPIVVVTKQDGGLQEIEPSDNIYAYPMLRVDELLDTIGGADFITTLDLAKGYWQVPITNEDKAKTAVITPNELYQFTLMPFALSRVPATLQRLMDTVLQGMDKIHWSVSGQRSDL